MLTTAGAAIFTTGAKVPEVGNTASPPPRAGEANAGSAVELAAVVVSAGIRTPAPITTVSAANSVRIHMMADIAHQHH